MERGARGFTLIEIMVVVLVIGLLSTIVAVNVMQASYKSKVSRIKSDFANIETALKMYKLENAFYPSTQDGLETLVLKKGESSAGTYFLDRMPLDPWNREYTYISPGDGVPYEISCLGADGQPGGTKENTDFFNWDR